MFAALTVLPYFVQYPLGPKKETNLNSVLRYPQGIGREPPAFTYCITIKQEEMCTAAVRSQAASPKRKSELLEEKMESPYSLAPMPMDNQKQSHISRLCARSICSKLITVPVFTKNPAAIRRARNSPLQSPLLPLQSAMRHPDICTHLTAEILSSIFTVGEFYDSHATHRLEQDVQMPFLLTSLVWRERV